MGVELSMQLLVLDFSHFIFVYFEQTFLLATKPKLKL